MAKSEKAISVGTKLYHFGYGPLTIVKLEETNGKTYLYSKIDDFSGVPYRLKKDIFSLVVFDKRAVGHWLFLEEENVLHEDFSFVLEGICGRLNPYTVDLVHKQYNNGYDKRRNFTIENGLIIDADGVIIGKSHII